MLKRGHIKAGPLMTRNEAIKTLKSKIIFIIIRTYGTVFLDSVYFKDIFDNYLDMVIGCIDKTFTE